MGDDATEGIKVFLRLGTTLKPMTLSPQNSFGKSHSH